MAPANSCRVSRKPISAAPSPALPNRAVLCYGARLSQSVPPSTPLDGKDRELQIPRRVMRATAFAFIVLGGAAWPARAQVSTMLPPPPAAWGAYQVEARDVNDAGDFIGDLDGFSGWLHTSDGQDHLIEFPGASVGTSVTAINNRRQVVGYYRGDDFVEHPFVWQNGSYAAVNIPVARGAAADINDAGVIVGWYEDGPVLRGFVASTAGTTTLPLAAGAWARQPTGINSAGVIVGVHGFLDPPFQSLFRYQAGVDQPIALPAGCNGEPGVPVAVADSGLVLLACGGNHFLSATESYAISLPSVSIPLGMNAGATAIVGVQYDELFRAQPFIARFSQLVDPVPDLLDGPAVTAVPAFLHTQGRPVQGVAADGVARVVVRIPAATAGQQFTVRLLNDHEPRVLSTSTQEDGALASVTMQTAWANQIVVHAEPVGQESVAFAIYRAPEDFPREGTPVNSQAFGPDDLKASRRVYLEITPQGGAPYTQVVEIVRPPVMLVHGIWADRTSWDGFFPLGTGAAPQFRVERADYSAPVRLAGAAPFPPQFQLRRARENSLGFSYVARGVADQIRNVVEGLAFGQGPTTLSVASVQADVVAHSMGGVVARTVVADPIWASAPRTYGSGRVHKLVTLNTPHLGSQMARGLLEDSNQCLRDALVELRLPFHAVESPNFSFRQVVFPDHTTADGAVGDLVDAPLSPALQRVAAPTVKPVPIAYVASSYDNWPSLNGVLSGARVLRTVCPDSPLAQQLTPSGWPAVFGGMFNDGVVSRVSQLNGLESAAALESWFQGVTHSAGMFKLGFQTPHAQQAAETASAVFRLLNRPAYDSAAYRKTP